MKVKVYVIDLEIPPRVKKWGLRLGIPLGVLLGGGAIAWAAGLHTWNNGDTLNASDLNGNFAQLQNEITSLPPINDQSASGYLRIGSIQICWGQATTAANGYTTVTFPAPFLDTSYSIQATAADAGKQVGSGMTGAQTNTEAALQYVNGAPSGPLQWVAIGRWK
jgi:hypothetical protein